MAQAGAKKRLRKRTDWVAKRDSWRPAEVSTLGIPYAGRKPGEKMLISSPSDVHTQLRKIKKGLSLTPSDLRARLAESAGADFACPLTTGIFLRIAAEAAWQEFHDGVTLENIAPFWRVVDSKQPVAKKLACGLDFIRSRRKAEGLAE